MLKEKALYYGMRFGKILSISLTIFPQVILSIILLISILAPVLEYQRLQISSLFYNFLHPVCNQMPTRCLFIKTSPMAVCSRCFAIYSSLLITGVFFLIRPQKRINWKLAILLIIPCLIDGSTQYLGLRLSNNFLRILTGTLAGVGLGIIIFPIQQRFLSFIEKGGVMKNKIPLLISQVILLVLISQVGLFAEEVFTLKDGAPVILKLTEEVSTSTKNLNDMVHLEVARDVIVDGKTVIKAGTPAEGVVSICVKPDIIGQEGRIAFTVNSTRTVDEQWVSLRANLTRSGQNKEILSAGAAYVCCPLFGLIKGESASFPVGSEVKAYTENSIKIKIQ